MATALANRRQLCQCGHHSGGGRAARWAEQERDIRGDQAEVIMRQNSGVNIVLTEQE